MILTEEQIQLREDLFLEILEEVANEHYDLAEDYEMTEDDAYIASIMLEYFIENYKQPTLKEAAYMSLSGTDINEELLDEMLEMMLDETVGSFVAGAVHGIRSASTKRKEDKAKSASQMAAKRLQAKQKASIKSAKTQKGLVGKIKAGYHQASVSKAQSRSVAADAAHSNALDKNHAAQKKQKGLASKIDTGISNIKNKVKSGVNRFASAVGRVAGSLA